MPTAMPSMSAAVSASALACGHGAQPVLQGLELDIRRGQLVGVFGSNGAGKTTLLQTLAGILPPAAGSLQLFGAAPTQARRQVGYVSQIAPDGGWSALAASEFVAAAWRGERWGWSSSRQRRQAAMQALAAVDASHLAARRMLQLSGGERQRVCIAQALVNPVELLLLDEPLANLDPRAQQAVLELVTRLSKQQGLTVLLSAHDINPLLGLMDQALVLAAGHGRLGGVDDVISASSLSALYGLPMAVTHVDRHVFIHPVGGFMAESLCCHDHHESRR